MWGTDDSLFFCFNFLIFVPDPSRLYTQGFRAVCPPYALGAVRLWFGLTSSLASLPASFNASNPWQFLTTLGSAAESNPYVYVSAVVGHITLFVSRSSFVVLCGVCLVGVATAPSQDTIIIKFHAHWRIGWTSEELSLSFGALTRCTFPTSDLRANDLWSPVQVVNTRPLYALGSLSVSDIGWSSIE